MTFDSGLRARHLLIGLCGALVGVVVVVSAIGRLAGAADIRDALSGADMWSLVGCAIGQLLVFAGYAGVLRRAIATNEGPRLPVGVSVQLALASFAATQLFAFAGVAGLAVVYWALRRVGRDRHQAAVVLIGLNTCVYLVFAVIAWLAAGAALIADQAPVAMTLPWLIGVPVLFVAARWFTARHASMDGRRRPRERCDRRWRQASPPQRGHVTGWRTPTAGRCCAGPLAIGPATSSVCGRRCTLSALRPSWLPSSPPTPPGTSPRRCRFL